jgi:transposase InsO family protein
MILGHRGQTAVYDTIRRMYHHPNLKAAIQTFQCEVCRQNKLPGAMYGELPPREAIVMPWEEVHVDLIGPWKIEINNKVVEFNALTCIDPVTNLVELVRVDSKTAAHVQQKFQNSWLARYPWPKRCVHDNGGEFIGFEFQMMLQNAGILDRPTTSRNPQANAICERMHQTIGNVLRTLLHGHPTTEEQLPAIVDNALATAMHTTRSTASRSIGYQSPGAIAFHRDMFLNVPFLADLQAICERRQLLIDENLRRQNARRRHYDYRIGEQVYVKAINPSKLAPRSHGPYPITRVHANGTITIQRTPHVQERVNLRRVYPHQTQVP